VKTEIVEMYQVLIHNPHVTHIWVIRPLLAVGGMEQLVLSQILAQIILPLELTTPLNWQYVKQ
jgi:hypothetical protein